MEIELHNSSWNSSNFIPYPRRSQSTYVGVRVLSLIKSEGDENDAQDWIHAIDHDGLQNVSTMTIGCHRI